MTKRQPVMKNRLDPAIERAIAELAVEQPALGQVRVANGLRKRGLTVSPAGVRCVWRRHDLETVKKRLKALGRARLDKGAYGEFESERPGCCGAQDTFYVGTLKGAGRICQQTFTGTYSKVGFAKLYDRETPITAADLPNDRVAPFFDQHGMRQDVHADLR